jgi:hypothetical protein
VPAVEGFVESGEKPAAVRQQARNPVKGKAWVRHAISRNAKDSPCRQGMASLAVETTEHYWRIGRIPLVLSNVADYSGM